jgi:hypothetical protein
MLKPSGACKTFSDYLNVIYSPYIRNQLLSVQRLDIIWDIYVKDSLKASTRSKRGKGVRQRVEPGVKIPSNWSKFLKVESNKTELFQYLAEQTVAIQCERNTFCLLVVILYCLHPHTAHVTYHPAHMKRPTPDYSCIQHIVPNKVLEK